MQSGLKLSAFILFCISSYNVNDANCYSVAINDRDGILDNFIAKADLKQRQGMKPERCSVA